MAEFKSVIVDPQGNRSYQRTLSGTKADALVGNSIGDVVDGIFMSLPGYRLEITGGSDSSGVPMRGDLAGAGRRRLLLSDSTGFHPRRSGQRKRKLVCGGRISADTSQLNLKIVSYGPKSVTEAFAEKEG